MTSEVAIPSVRRENGKVPHCVRGINSEFLGNVLAATVELDSFFLRKFMGTSHPSKESPFNLLYESPSLAGRRPRPGPIEKAGSHRSLQ